MAVADHKASDPPGAAASPAVSKAPGRQARGFVHLKTRAEFLRAAKGARFHTSVFSLQAAPNSAVEGAPARFGFTVTKKTAGAVQRNRIRRRLREAVRVAVLAAKPGYDYVLVAREAALAAPFVQLTDELARALAGVHARRGERRRGPERPPAMSVRPTDLEGLRDTSATPSRTQSGQAHFGKDQ